MESERKLSEDNYVRPLPHEISPLKTLRAHTDSIDFIRLFEKASPFLLSASHDKTLKLWDLHTQAPIITLQGHTEAVFGCDINDSGQILSCSPDESIRLWDPRSGKEVSRGLGHTNKIYSVIFSGNTQAVSCGRDRKLLLWDLKKLNSPILRFGDDSCGTFRSCAIHNNMLIASTAESTVECFDLKSGSLIFREGIEFDASFVPEEREWLGPPTIIYSIKFYSNGDFITGHQDNAIRRFSYSGGLTEVFLRRGHYDYVRHIEIAKDEGFFVSCCQDGSVRVWKNNVPAESLVGHLQIVSSACITEDQTRVFTSSYDQDINIYALRSS